MSNKHLVIKKRDIDKDITAPILPAGSTPVRPPETSRLPVLVINKVILLFN